MVCPDRKAGVHPARLSFCQYEEPMEKGFTLLDMAGTLLFSAHAVRIVA